MDPMWNNYSKLFVIFDQLLVIMLSHLHEVAYEC